MPGFSTTAIHHGYDPRDHHGALVPPVYQSATFTFASAAGGGRCFAGEADGYIYTRIANPTLALLESRLAVLEGGAPPIAVGPGMGANTATLWTPLRPGDENVGDLPPYRCPLPFLHPRVGGVGGRRTPVATSQPAPGRGPRSRRARGG